ncbi:MAG: transcriptional regulator, partial [Pseudomonadales bacterium]|nr:transcriptional regulator [Pseudomonadales bacterium]
FESDDERSSFLIRLPVHEGFAGEVTPEVTAEVGTKSGPSRDQVLELRACEVASPFTDLMAAVGRSNRTKFREAILTPLLEAGLVEMTIPDKPRSRLQKYRLTSKGKAWLKEEQA